MNTPITGKQWAARITAVAALGSMATAGIAAAAVDAATVSHAVGTNSVVSQDDGTAQNSGSGQGNDYNGYSNGSPVQPGNGGAVNGRSSGS